MTPFSHELKDAVLFVTGYLDEHSNFQTIDGVFDKVNLQAVTGFSSIGLRQFMQFLHARDWKSIWLQDCPVDFVEAMNVMSGLLKGTKVKVESVMVPFKCPECLMEIELLTQCSEIVVEAASVSTPTPLCHKCREHLRLHVDPHEYFLFLYG